MAGFFNDQEREDRKAYKQTVIYFIAAISLVMLLFLVIIYMNTKDKQERARAEALRKQAEEQAREEELTEQRLEDEALGIGEHNITSEDLDFWEMYEKDKQKDEKKGNEEELKESEDDDYENIKDRDKNNDDVVKRDPTVSSNANEDSIMDNTVDDRKNETTGALKKEKEDDGKHIKATAKGSEATWYEILKDVEKHDYDLKTYLSMDEESLEYKSDNVYTKRGVDVSKYQGVIDWGKVKAAGIDFAMIRVGARGYGSGQITLDDNFVINIMGAKAAGLDTGVYFFTQAITEEEAVEEANFTVGALMNYGVTYPVAVDVEWISGDKARTDDLTPEERTGLVIKYCDTIKAFGYQPVIYADRDMLIAGLLPEKIKNYDVWLSDDLQPEDGTDYPYRFSMWQYTKKGKVDGIEGEVDLNLRFFNTKEK
ncbi:MAG: glycoside hydrolase family 25 protein [Lachnospiraceae bacterium]|nr:glycoside hydrolase family 25 protein [Lachnospiraceae bacterium]